jgi:hypothetical protein
MMCGQQDVETAGDLRVAGRLLVLGWAILFAFSAASRADDSLTSREEAALRAAAELVAGSVVQIRTIGGLDTIGGTLIADGPTTGTRRFGRRIHRLQCLQLRSAAGVHSCHIRLGQTGARRARCHRSQPHDRHAESVGRGWSGGWSRRA